MIIQKISSVGIKKIIVILSGCMAFLFNAVLASAGDYLDSSHGNSTAGVDRSSVDSNLTDYSSGNCAHCHLQHASLAGNVYTFGDYLLYNGVSGIAFCTECHDVDGPASDDILTEYNKSNGHGPGNTSHVDTPLECLECHNPHQAQAPTAGTARGNNATTGSIKGVSGVDISGGWPTPGTPNPVTGGEILATPTFVPIDPITQEWQLCLKCHGGQVSGLKNIAEEINPNNYSAHPVASTTWKNTNLAANPGWLNPPFNVANQPIYCSDCHGSDNTLDPKGPHGSNNVYMLKEIGSSPDGPNDPNSYDDLCKLCHLTDNSNSIFGSHTAGAHPYDDTGTGNSFGCTACHGGTKGNFGGRLGNIHGTSYRWPDQPEVRGTPQPGLNAIRFLVGGYNIELFTDSKGTQKCTADEAVAQTGVGDCGMGAHTFP